MKSWILKLFGGISLDEYQKMVGEYENSLKNVELRLKEEITRRMDLEEMLSEEIQLNTTEGSIGIDMSKLVLNHKNGTAYEITIYDTAEAAGENHLKVGEGKFVALGEQNDSNATPLYVIRKGKTLKEFVLNQYVSLPPLLGDWRWAVTDDFVSPDGYGEVNTLESYSLKSTSQSSSIALIKSTKNITGFGFQYNKPFQNHGFYIFAEDDSFVYGTSMKKNAGTTVGLRINKTKPVGGATFTSQDWGVSTQPNGINIGKYVKIMKISDKIVFSVASDLNGSNTISSYKTLAQIRSEINSPNAKLALGYINYSPTSWGTIDNVQVTTATS